MKIKVYRGRSEYDIGVCGNDFSEIWFSKKQALEDMKQAWIDCGCGKKSFDDLTSIECCKVDIGDNVIISKKEYDELKEK